MVSPRKRLQTIEPKHPNHGILLLRIEVEAAEQRQGMNRLQEAIQLEIAVVDVA